MLLVGCSSSAPEDQADAMSSELSGFTRPSQFNPGRGVHGDLNNDGIPDLLWDNPRRPNSQSFAWFMNGNQVTEAATVRSAHDDSWRPVGTGDFNHDGYTDIVWDSYTQVSVWLLQGTTTPFATPTWDTDMHPLAVGDFDGDHNSDLVFYQPGAGVSAVIWRMNGTQTPVVSAPIPIGEPGWSISSVADFDRDGRDDILWRNWYDGRVRIWKMNGGTVDAAPMIGNVPDLAWRVNGTGDFDGDGNIDLLWQHRDGRVGIWFMNGMTPVSYPVIATNSDPAWAVYAVDDYDRDGKADLFWRESKTGEVGMWLMNGTSARMGGISGAPAPSQDWHLSHFMSQEPPHN
jgi:hypothetical protein